MDGEELDTNIKISEYQKTSDTHRFKSYTILIIFILIIGGFVVLTGKYGPDFFGILIFLIILSMPVFVLLRNQLAFILPKKMADILLEVDDESRKGLEFDLDIDKPPLSRTEIISSIKEFQFPKLLKEVFKYIIIILLIIGGVMLLRKANNEYMVQRDGLIKILGSFLCFCIGGVILLDWEPSNKSSISVGNNNTS
jgi:hypothetical protein